MELQDLRRELQQALPASHPFLEKFDRFIGLLPSTSQLTPAEEEAQLYSILDALDDWKRGIFDWEDVEHRIREVRAFIS
jgi:microcystin degradation protein MlrC